MKKIFFLSGGNSDLAKAEVLALAGKPASESYDDVLIVDCDFKYARLALSKRVYEFTQRVCSKIGWEILHDPFSQYWLTKEVAGEKASVEFVPARMEGRWVDYNFRVEPYSLNPKTPEQHLQSLTTAVAQVFAPFLPFMQQAGIGIDFEMFIRKWARLASLPDLEDILVTQEPTLPPEKAIGAPPGGGGANGSPTRRQVSTRTAQGQLDTMEQLFAGGRPQESELADLLG